MTLARPNLSAAKRPAFRPPIGVPLRDEPRRRGAVVSLVLHVLIVLLVLAPPVFLATKVDYVQQKGAGGAGPAGGGGGGSGGSGGFIRARERLRYMVLPKAAVSPVVPPPVEVPVVKPVVPPKPEPPKPTPTPEPTPAPVQPAVSTASSQDASVVAGTGGGSGKDGTAGSGPGSGGGVGSGVGTGRGTGSGPGTGGGEDAIYPPAVISLPILPLPVPGKVRPYKMTAYFEVDTLGNAKLIAFNPSNDGGYNKRIREMLGEIRFRAATRFNGRPVIDTAVVTAEASRS